MTFKAAASPPRSSSDGLESRLNPARNLGKTTGAATRGDLLRERSGHIVTDIEIQPEPAQDEDAAALGHPLVALFAAVIAT